MTLRKNKQIVGLWSGHDASFCVLDDGRPVIHTELERHLRVKEPPGDSIEMFYKYHGDDTKIVGLATCHSEKGIKEHSESWRRINLTGAPLYVCGHHQAHAANAFFSSNFPEATIVTVDGGGIEDDSGTCVGGSVWEGVDNQINKLRYVPISSFNVGGVWSRCTRYIFRYESGWPQGHQAGTVMALAAMGMPEQWLEDFSQMFMHTHDLARVVAAPLGHVKGMSARDVKSPQHPFLKRFEDAAASDEQTRYNMAASLQLATENVLRQFIDEALKQNPDSQHLCLSGGVFLNSVAVGKIHGWFPHLKGIYVPPTPHDGGLTIGAAQYAWHHILRHPRIKWVDNFTPYLGAAWDPREALDAAVKANKITVEQSGDSQVIDLLDQGKIVSIYNDRAESGRRALGNRSIIADPRCHDMKSRVNDKVKHRQWFRPFAPSILRERVAEWFVNDVDSPYMSFVAKFKLDKIDQVPAVVHFDNTARLQTVSTNDNPWYHGFLLAWEKKSGVPILLNTSFNDKEPICETPEDALKCFLNTDIDYLYFPQSGIIVSKA